MANWVSGDYNSCLRCLLNPSPIARHPVSATGVRRPMPRHLDGNALDGLDAVGARQTPFRRAVDNSFHQHDVDGDVELLFRRADDDAVDRRNIGKVAPDAQDDVIVLDEEIVGGVQSDPAKLFTAP